MLISIRYSCNRTQSYLNKYGTLIISIDNLKLVDSESSTMLYQLCISILLIFYSNCLPSTAAIEDQGLIVQTFNGLVKGRILESVTGEKYVAFQGIRYATAARFEEAKPVQNWTGIYEAVEDGPVCPQSLGHYDNMSEDCLHLNIYIKLDAFEEAILRPVLVYIHGGAFNEGSNTFNHDVGPQYLMDYNVLFVTINYRLNIFGFISTGTEEAPGNLGLKDQALAIKWIVSNIKYFKGNAKAITLMGESAGAMSVTLHMASSLTKSHFQRVILMSGSAIAQRKLPTDLLELTKRQALQLNCSVTEIKSMITCLKQIPMEILADGYKNLKEWADYPVFTWIPVIEPNFGQVRFLSEDPLLTYRHGDISKVQALIGVTNDEWAFPLPKFLDNETLFQELDYKFEERAPLCFMYEKGTVNSMIISQHLRNETFGDHPITKDNIKGLHQLFSEGIITFGVFRTAQLLALNEEDLFFYRFSYKKRYSHVYNKDGTPFGAVHADDLFYLFVMKNKAPIFNSSDPEWGFLRNMTRMWVNFVRHGNPVPDNDPIVGHIVWPPYQEDNQVRTLVLIESKKLNHSFSGLHEFR